MATPSFVGFAPVVTGTGALTVAAVAGVVADDLIILFVESANENVATPSGYTLSPLQSTVVNGTAAAAGGVRLTTFYQFATGADTTTTVADSGNHTVATKVVYRNVYKTTPFAASSFRIWSTATTTLDALSATAPRPNSRVVFAAALDLDATNAAPVSSSSGGNTIGFTVRAQGTTNAGAGGGLAVGDGELVSDGFSGNPTFTLGTASIAVGALFILNEAPPPSNNTLTVTIAEEPVKDSLGSVNVTVVNPPWIRSLIFADLPAGGGTVAISPELVIRTNSNSFLRFSSRVYFRQLAPRSSSQTINIYTLWQYRVAGDIPWIDVDTETLSNFPSTTNSSAILTQTGVANVVKEVSSGLLPDTNYDVRLVGRNAANVAYVVETVYDSNFEPGWMLATSNPPAGNATETGTDTCVADANVTGVISDRYATGDAFETGPDTVAADANVTGSGTGDRFCTVDVAETGSDTVSVDIEPRIWSFAEADVTETGSDTAEAISIDHFKYYYAIHECSVHGAGTSEQTRGHVIYNTGDYTSVRLDQYHHSLLYRPTDVGSYFESRMKVGWKYRKVGDPSWIVLAINLPETLTERNTSVGAWDPASWPESSVQSMITTFTGNPAVRISGLLQDTDYEIMPTLRFDTDSYSLPPTDCKAWAEDPYYEPYSDLRSWISYRRLHGPLVISITDSGPDTVVADVIAEVQPPREVTVDAVEVGSDTLVCTVNSQPVSIATGDATEVGADTVEATVSPISTASVAIAEPRGRDLAVVDADVLVEASISVIEAVKDTAASSITVTPHSNVTISGLEIGADTASVLVGVLAQAAFAGQEDGADTASVPADAIATAEASIAEVGADTLAASIDAISTAAIAVSETGQDTVSLAVTVPAYVLVAVTESSADTASVPAAALVQASLAATESGADSASIDCDAIATLSVNVIEPSSDSVAAIGKLIIQAAIAAVETGFDTAVVETDTVPHTVCTVYVNEVGSDTLTCIALVYDIDLHVVQCKHNNRVISLASTPVVISSSGSAVSVKSAPGQPTVVTKSTAAEIIADDCA